MKKIFIIFTLVASILSCQKEEATDKAQTNINKVLRDSLSTTDFGRLQQDKLLTYTAGGDHYIKISLAGKVSGDFVY